MDCSQGWAVAAPMFMFHSAQKNVEKGPPLTTLYLPRKEPEMEAPSRSAFTSAPWPGGGILATENNADLQALGVRLSAKDRHRPKFSP